MRGYVPLDPETDVSAEQFAVVFVPRRSRKRFSIGCVEVMPDQQSALQHADEANNLYPARVIGPSKSSEGQYLYYLVEWLR